MYRVRRQAGKYQPFVEVSPGQFHSDGQAWFVYLSAENSRVGFVPEADGQISGSLSGKVCEGGAYTVSDRALVMTIPLSCAGKAATADQPRFMVSTRHVRKDGETTGSDYAPEYTEPAPLVANR